MSERGRNRNAERKSHRQREREYWGPRKPPMQTPSKNAKRLTHALERAEAKRLAQRDFADAPKQEAM